MEKAIEIKNLSHRFGLAWALRDLSFSAAAGEGVAVLGPNASGKSTLL
ncbi:MAG: ATP-binding cassette domain-containing protein, partial [Deltaproteobacteria bacterium]|nr:ATP-binding cassette domain-containing protein [Deltaproteobacteria bacterium]